MQLDKELVSMQGRGVPGGGGVLGEDSFSDSNQEIHFGFVHVEH